jgi:hypothetical protein
VAGAYQAVIDIGDSVYAAKAEVNLRLLRQINERQQ